MGRPKSRNSRNQLNVYYTAANIGRNCRRGLGLRFQLYSKQHVANPKHIKAASFLVNTCMKALHMIDSLMKESGLTKKLRSQDTWLARMLVTEIVFGRKSFSVFDRVSKIVYGFKNLIRRLGKETIYADKVLAFHPQYLRVSTDEISMDDMKNYLTLFDFEEVYTNVLTRLEYMRTVRDLTEKQYVEDRDMSSLLVFNPKATKTLAFLQMSCKGKFFLQDKASCLAAPILSPTAGSTVLDMCAAPGMKTLHLMSFMKNFGHVVAVDKSSPRLQFLRDIVQAKKYTNITVLDQDAFCDDFTDRFSKLSFTHILLDPPCSGTGITKNYDYNPDARKNKTRVQKLHNLQAKMLRRALTEFPKVRRVLYSTCSMNPVENEEVVEEILKLETDFNLVDVASHFPSLSHGSATYPNGPKCLSLTPDCDLTNGFFIALFERNGFEEPVNTSCFDTQNHNEIEVIAAYTEETMPDEMKTSKPTPPIDSTPTSSSDTSIRESPPIRDACQPITPIHPFIDLTLEESSEPDVIIKSPSSSPEPECKEPDSTVSSKSSSPSLVPVRNESEEDDCVEVPIKISERSFFGGDTVSPEENLVAVINNEDEDEDEEVDGDRVASEPDYLNANDLGFEDIQDLDHNGF